MASELVRQLIDSGIHYGHRASRWNPKMSPYIFSKRNLIHIIDIRETVKGLLRAKKFVSQVVGGGGDVLFVGTKRQARQSIVDHAVSVDMPYVIERWLGGTLTNFRTIRARLSRLEELEAADTDGSAAEYSKKQISRNAREKRKIERNLSGIRKMSKLPGALIIVDVQREHLAVREARNLNIPTVCLIDTDSNPDFADIPIPGNDDAMRSIEIIIEHMTEAVKEGLRGRTEQEEAPTPKRRSERATLARADEGVSEPAVSTETADASADVAGSAVGDASS